MPPMQFSTRAQAFSFMLNYLLNEKKLNPLQASEQADKFADIYATNMGLPNEPPPQGIDKYLSVAEKIGNYLQQNPKVVEYGLGALTFIAGFVTKKEIDQHTEQTPPPPPEPIDFENLK